MRIAEVKSAKAEAALIACLECKRNFTDAIPFVVASMSTPATIKGADSTSKNS